MSNEKSETQKIAFIIKGFLLGGSYLIVATFGVLDFIVWYGGGEGIFEGEGIFNGIIRFIIWMISLPALPIVAVVVGGAAIASQR